jgi:trans-aconitate 2-methyltransferase
MSWNPDQYQKFKIERSAPFNDLLELVQIRPNLRAVDLGCGTGELTQRIADLLPNCELIGIDNSPQMLANAHTFERINLKFRLDDLENLQSQWDLIFSNAALHWCDNHEQLIAQLFNKLTPGGQIAVQVPSNHTHISQGLIAEIAQEKPFSDMLNGYVRNSPVLSISDYARLLFELNAENIVVYEKVYGHILENSDAVIEWLSGTALVPYFERLGIEKDNFVRELRIKLQYHMPGSPLFYPFKRIFFTANKSG